MGGGGGVGGGSHKALTGLNSVSILVRCRPKLKLS